MVAFPHGGLSPLPGLAPLIRVVLQNLLGCKVLVLVDASWIQGEFMGGGGGGNSSSPHTEEPTSVHPIFAPTPRCKHSSAATSHPKKAPPVGSTSSAPH